MVQQDIEIIDPNEVRAQAVFQIQQGNPQKALLLLEYLISQFPHHQELLRLTSIVREAVQKNKKGKKEFSSGSTNYSANVQNRDMMERALEWLKNNIISGKGIVISTNQRVPYPEVSGYVIPTLIRSGEKKIAYDIGRWLVSVQFPDGSIPGSDGKSSFAFDTGQVLRGWVALLEYYPEFEGAVRKACNWLISTADPVTRRLAVPPLRNIAWSLGQRGRISEGVNLYALWPILRAGELINVQKYCDFVHESASSYIRDLPLIDFAQPNMFSHFFAYIQEALAELGFIEESRCGMESVARYQLPNGAVPGYFDVPWVCSTGLAQLAGVWFTLGDTDRGNRALQFVAELQNPSGGFFGSYGFFADYMPSEEISWTAKFAVDAAQRQIKNYFDSTSNIYRTNISGDDGRIQAILRRVGDLNGKRLLDAGCGRARYSKYFKTIFSQSDVTAMDISPEMLRAVPENIHAVEGSLLNIPFSDQYFDAIICVEALEHAIQIPEAIHEMSRVLKKNGVLIVIDKNKDKLGVLQMPSWEKWFSRDELIKYFESENLRAGTEFIGYDNVIQPDGLFICWWGYK